MRASPIDVDDDGGGVREELKALIKLAEIDEASRDVEDELEAIPRRLEEMKADLAKLEELLDREKQQLSEAEGLRNATSDELSTRNEMLVRARAKAAKARSAREAEAAERELDAVRRSSRDREGERERLEEALGQMREAYEAHEKELTDFRAEVAEEEKTGTARAEELQKKLDDVKAGRMEAASKVPRQVLARYDRIRRNRPSPVVEVIESTCQGCRLQITPMQFQKLHYADSIEQCPHCMRFLFLKDVLLVGREVGESV